MIDLIHHSEMSTIANIRRENARALASLMGGHAELARRLGISDSQMNQTIGKNPSRNIGSNLARRIEKASDKEVGFLDSVQSAVTEKQERVHLVYVSQKELSMLTAYREATEEGRAVIESAAEASSLSAGSRFLKHNKS